MEARQKAEELAEMERRQNEDGNVRFRKKGGEAKSSVVNEDLEDDEFENLPKQEGMVKGAVARGVWGQKEIRGRREGVKKSKKQKNREKRKNEEQKEKRKAYGESQQELSKLFKTILKEKSDFVKENIRKLLNRKEDTQDQDQL